MTGSVTGTGTSVRAQGEAEIVVSRRFAAPATTVFAAWTEPAQLRRWLGRSEWEMVECVSDPRPGGRRRMVWQSLDRPARMGIDGEYVSVSRPAEYVCTETFDGSADHTTQTARFREHDDQTLVVLTIRYDDGAARGRALATPMAEGLATGFSRLDDLIVTMTATWPATGPTAGPTTGPATAEPRRTTKEEQRWT